MAFEFHGPLIARCARLMADQFRGIVLELHVCMLAVCIKVLGELDAKGKDLENLEKEFRQKCKKLDGVEKRFVRLLTWLPLE
jgi:hypothetical protein